MVTGINVINVILLKQGKADRNESTAVNPIT